MEKIGATFFEVHKEQIRKNNYDNYRFLITGGLMISFALLIASYFLHYYIVYTKALVVMFSYFLGLKLFEQIYIKNHLKYITFYLYVAITPIMAVSIWIGTFLYSHSQSIAIMVSLSVLPLMILDKYIRMFMYITIVAVIYLVNCYIAKDFQYFVVDSVNLIIYYVLAIGINFFMLTKKIKLIENNAELKKKSEIDILTSIYNRGTGVEKVEKHINQKIYGAFLMIDIDDFKNINDQYGHRAGDTVLQELASLLKAYNVGENIVFRMGGDELAMYITDLRTIRECEKFCQELIRKIKLLEIPIIKNKKIGVSIGCALYNETVKGFNELYKNSDTCLYQVKNNGKNQYAVFQPKDRHAKMNAQAAIL